MDRHFNNTSRAHNWWDRFHKMPKKNSRSLYFEKKVYFNSNFTEMFAKFQLIIPNIGSDI